MRKALLALLLIPLGGCASSPPPVDTPPTLPRAKPAQALAQCRTQSATDACRFRPEFAQLALKDQLAMLGNCLEVVAVVMWECDEKQRRLAEFIEAGQ